METAVATAEIEERIKACIEACFDDPPYEDVMVATFIDGVAFTFEDTEGFRKNRGPTFPL